MKKIKNKIIHRQDDLEAGRTAEVFAEPFEKISALSRRRFLSQGSKAMGAVFLAQMAGLLAWEQSAFGADTTKNIVKTGQFIFPRLRFAVNDNTTDRWDIGPIGDVNIRKKLGELTNLNISNEPKIVTLADFDDMCRHPFVFMTSEGNFELSEVEENNMREFLERGGFIHADDCVFRGKDLFFQAYRKLMNKLFPDNPMRKIPNDHELYHIYFDFPNGCPHMQGVPLGAYGMFEPGTGRIMTINTPGDLHCGWMCRYFGKNKDMESIKMGINIIIYFLTH